MDIPRAIEVLEDFVDLTREYLQVGMNGMTNGRVGTAALARRVELDQAIRMRIVSVQRLIEASLGPSAAAQMLRLRSGLDKYLDAREAAEAAIGALRDGEMIDEILSPGPQLAATGLHEWVWEPARKQWSGGHRRAAIQSAATRLDSETQARMERWDIHGKALANQAWSAEPPSVGHRRLRPAGVQPGTEAYTSQLEGARSLHVGVMQAIRNRATHDLEEPSEQDGLERLAALSVVARLVAEARVESVS